MPISRTSCLAMLCIMLLLGLPAEALAMRCGTRIVSNGDVQAKVLKNCGEPLQVVQRLGYRAGIYPDLRVRSSLSVGGNSTAATDSAGARVYRNSFYGRSEVVIEEWTYNFGPHKLMRKVTFENGVVVDVDTLGRGFRE